MSVTIKSAREIELMREAGRILAKVHEELERRFIRACPHWTLTDWARS